MQGSWAECGLPLLRALVAFGSPEISRTIFACETRAPVRWRRVWGNRPGACPSRGVGCGALPRDRSWLRPADGACPAAVPDRAADRGAIGLEEERRAAVYYTALFDQCRLSHRRARAGEVVRR